MPGNCSIESSFGGFPSRKAYAPHVSLANLHFGGGTPCWRLDLWSRRCNVCSDAQSLCRKVSKLFHSLQIFLSFQPHFSTQSFTHMICSTISSILESCLIPHRKLPDFYETLGNFLKSPIIIR